jgi:hypothetical protein
MSEYIIKAHSKSRNQTQRQLNLIAGDPTTLALARQTADAFAQSLNLKTKDNKDWRGQVELVSEQYVRTE